MGLGEADTKPVVYFSRGFSCALLCDVQCGELSPGQKGETLRLKQDSRALPVDVQRRTSGVKKESQEETELEEDVEVVGFSTAVKQFYKARGPQLQTPAYRGESSEVDLLAWKRGIEKYFETYGVSRQREKVSLAADLLEGEAAKWWNSLWMSGRDAGIATWEQLIAKLRERFLLPEGEMRVVG